MAFFLSFVVKYPLENAKDYCASVAKVKSQEGK
jgi:hypothetical protein